MLLITGVDSVLKRSSTKAAKKTMDSGVAGRSMMAVVCSTSVGGGGSCGGGGGAGGGGYCWLAASLEMKVSISARPAVSRLVRSGLVSPRGRW